MSRYADILDRKYTKKALRRSPGAPRMLALALSFREAQALAEAGWQIDEVVPNMFRGTSLGNRYLVSKEAPSRAA